MRTASLSLDTIRLFDSVYNYRTLEASRLPLAQMAGDLLRRMMRDGAARGSEAKKARAA